MPSKIYYLPPWSLTVEDATLATSDQLEAGENLYVVARGKHTIEALNKASKQEVRAYISYLNRQSVA